MAAHDSLERLWVLGEFGTPAAMVEAARRLREAGFAAAAETHSPYPVEGAYEALAIPRSRMPWIVAAGGLAGVLTAYLLQWWCNAVDYPINVGGRPEHALPSFIPITFELGVLFAGLGAFFGLWGLLGLPRPHHPVFEVEQFRTASIDHFWVSVSTPRPADEADGLERLLKGAGALRVARFHERVIP